MCVLHAQVGIPGKAITCRDLEKCINNIIYPALANDIRLELRSTISRQDGTGLICMHDVTYSYVRHDSYIHMCDMTHSF